MSNWKWALLSTIFKSAKKGDGTAQAVARARHAETIWPVAPTQKRLFEDPYAKHLYAGSAVTAQVIRWLGPKAVGLLSNFQAGLQQSLAGRTAEFDNQVRAAIQAGCKQYVILGAGYDTRGLRLGLPQDVNIFEVDQPKVQGQKRAKLSSIPGLTIPSNVHFVAMDFNTDNIAELASHPSYNPGAPTVFTLEGVTPYIPKNATGSTLATAATISGPGSHFLLSYMPQDFWDAPEKCGDVDEIRKLKWLTENLASEPLISGWDAAELAETMQTNGFTVERDVSLPELSGDYFVPAGRPVPEEQMVIVDRFVTAVKK